MAAIVQVPTVTSVTVDAETVQTLVVVEVNVTAKPEEAVAETVNGDAPNDLPDSAANVMVCVPLLITTLLATWVAALKVALPA